MILSARIVIVITSRTLIDILRSQKIVKSSKYYSKNDLIKTKNSPLKFNFDSSTAAKIVNNEAKNSTLNFVNFVKSNVNTNSNIKTLELVV